MNENMNLVVAGFGGQGILFTGKVAAYAGLINGKHISWLPSYGPEMRGGTANCSICISDREIGSPLVLNPDAFIAMNQPALEKFENSVVPGGLILADNSIINSKVERDDISVFYVPATKMADENGLKGLANIILLGKLLKETMFCSLEVMDAAIAKSVPANRPQMVDFNCKAIRLGMES